MKEDAAKQALQENKSCSMRVRGLKVWELLQAIGYFVVALHASTWIESDILIAPVNPNGSYSMWSTWIESAEAPFCADSLLSHSI